MRPLLTFLFVVAAAPSWSQDKAAKKTPDGVYAVLRESAMEKDVLPLRDKEALIVQRHRYLKDGDKAPPRFLVIRPTPDVRLELDGPPKAEKEAGMVTRILLKLRPAAAADLERLTAANLDKQVAIVLGGEVVTVHRIREAIKGGEVQITNCAAGAADFLLEQLQAHVKK
jgi:preprotein translocase subunit SecD